MVWYVLQKLQELKVPDEVILGVNIVGILTGQLQIICR